MELLRKDVQHEALEVNQGQRAVEKEGNELCPQGGHGERERGMNNVGAQCCVITMGLWCLLLLY